MSAFIVGYTEGEYGAAYCGDCGADRMTPAAAAEYVPILADDDRADYGPCATCGADLFAGVT